MPNKYCTSVKSDHLYIGPLRMMLEVSVIEGVAVWRWEGTSEERSWAGGVRLTICRARLLGALRVDKRGTRKNSNSRWSHPGPCFCYFGLVFKWTFNFIIDLQKSCEDNTITTHCPWCGALVIIDEPILIGSCYIQISLFLPVSFFSQIPFGILRYIL